MCGIAGLVAPLAAEDLRARLSRMTESVRHRGPDAGGLFFDGAVGLGHRRLSIQDLSEAGAQPMTLPGCATIVFNGEIYNFRELRAELAAQGHVFRGHSDTEVILHSFQAWGDAGLSRLEGIFTLALWVPLEARLILMRDRLGVKPLFYAHDARGFAFGSEIKAVRAAGLSDDTIDRQGLSEYLWFGNCFEDRTMLSAVRSLPPGHMLVLKADRATVSAWWRIEQWLDAPAFAGSEQDAATAVREALDRSVSRQLVADVPVGLFLSGGIDSSAIAASAARHAPRLASYSVGFDFEGGVNELPRARRVAQALGLDHHELHVAGPALEQTLIALARAHDEPFADAANIPLYLLAKSLNGAVKVVLQGDGGDELFAGYRRYALLANARWWRRVPQAALPLLDRAGGRTGERIARLARALGQRADAMRMALLLTTDTLECRPDRFLLPEARQALFADTDPFRAYRVAARRFSGRDPVQQMLLTDLTTQLPTQFLPKVDRATMAWGLEARVPLLDEQLASLAVGLPARWKARGAQKKIVLRNALRGRVPAEVLDGPKTGFGVPYEHWLRSSLYDMARGAVLDSGVCDRLGLDRPALAIAFEQHRAGTHALGYVLWKFFQLGLWHQHCGMPA